MMITKKYNKFCFLLLLISLFLLSSCGNSNLLFNGLKKLPIPCKNGNLIISGSLNGDHSIIRLELSNKKDITKGSFVLMTNEGRILDYMEVDEFDKSIVHGRINDKKYIRRFRIEEDIYRKNKNILIILNEKFVDGLKFPDSFIQIPVTFPAKKGILTIAST